MRIAIERRPPRRPESRPVELLEIVTPRTNEATVTPAENLFAAISLPEPFSLEIAADSRQRWFLARAGSAAMRRHLEDQLGAVYPQAELRRLDVERAPPNDPARRFPGERAAACRLELRGPQYLPLRTFRDLDLAAGRAPHAAQADPVLAILSAMGNLPDGWRSLSQLVLRPAPDDWCRGYHRLAVEHPLAAERASAAAGGTSLLPVLLLGGALAAGTLAWQAYAWYLDGEWWPLLQFAASAGVGVPGLGTLLWRLRGRLGRPVYDPRLVEEKIGRIAYAAQLRLAVFAPADAPPEEVRRRLDQIAAAYRQFSLATGNGLRPRPLRLPGESDGPAPTGGGAAVSTDGAPRPTALCVPAPLPARGATFVLNTRELAGLWHLPQAAADAPLVERTTARRWLPLPADVARGCPAGVSTHQGRSVRVSLPDDLLLRHQLLVAKTRRGKSGLLLRLARHLMEAPDAGAGDPAGAARPRALVLVDPHRDLARAALGLVPEARRGAVVFLDVGAVGPGDRPFALNLIDVGLGWHPDRAVANALLIFKREFGRNWGPRMEDAFRYALKTLYAANRLTCASDPVHGRDRQFTVLQVPTLLADPDFQQALLPTVLPAAADPELDDWWDNYYRPLDRRQRLDIINPVQTKVQKFAGTDAGKAIVGQSRSTVDPARWLRDGAIVLIDTAKGVVGDDTAALIGGTLLNLLKEAITAQAALAPRERRGVAVLVDEFQSVPGADYEAYLCELAKYRASLVLATQSLEQLEKLDRLHERALRATVFANLDGLYAFHTSAEDAKYLVRELGGGVEEADLRELGEHRCYAKLSTRGERLPVFSLELDPPPPDDPALAAALAGASALRHGRDWAAIRKNAAAIRALVRAARSGVIETPPPAPHAPTSPTAASPPGPTAPTALTAPAVVPAPPGGGGPPAQAGEGTGAARAAAPDGDTLENTASAPASRPKKAPARSQHRDQKKRKNKSRRDASGATAAQERQLTLPAMPPAAPEARQSPAGPSASPGTRDAGGEADGGGVAAAGDGQAPEAAHEAEAAP